MRWTALIMVVVVGGCGGSGSDRERSCTTSADCAPQGGNPGTCVPSPSSSNSWCAYQDAAGCTSTLRWSALAGDGLASECVLPADGGMDSDAAANDGMVVDATIEADAEPCCRLSVNAQNRGLGTGTVTISPSGGSATTCANMACSRFFDPGTMVDLIATPGSVGR